MISITQEEFEEYTKLKIEVAELREELAKARFGSTFDLTEPTEFQPGDELRKDSDGSYYIFRHATLTSGGIPS